MNEKQLLIYNELIPQYNFDVAQKDEIKLGLKMNLDVGLYARPEFNDRQMQEIRLGLKHGIDVSPYLNPSIKCEEMERIRLELESNK